MPRRSDRTQLTVYLPRELAGRLSGRAQMCGRSVSEHLREVITQDLGSASAFQGQLVAGASSASSPLAQCPLPESSLSLPSTPSIEPLLVEALKEIVELLGGD